MSHNNKPRLILFFILLLSFNRILLSDREYELWYGNDQYPLSSISLLNEGKPFCHNKPRVLKSNFQLPNKKKLLFNYYSNSSDTLVVLGPGFPGTRKNMCYLINLLGHSFDYLTFDYQWSNRCIQFFLENPSHFINPINYFLIEEYQTVIAAVNHIKKNSSYNTVLGFGQCFSTWTFCLAQQKYYEKNSNEQLFDGIILDSSVDSISSIAQRLLEDPWLPINPQEGGFPQSLRSFLLPSFTIKALTLFTKKLFPQTLSSIINKMKPTPLFFIHGANDCYAPLTYFKEKTWQKLINQIDCYALITPFEHSHNLQDKALMQTFLTSFIAMVQNKSKLFEAS